MENLPTKAAEEGVTFTLADFFEAGGDQLCLSVIAGKENMGLVMEEPVVNRPGLALTGFFENFAASRLQVIGNAESAYLNSLTLDVRLERLKELVKRKALVFVCTDWNSLDREVLNMISDAGGVVLMTPLKTRMFSRTATFTLEQLGAPRTSIYGTMVDVGGVGVLLIGESGVGKSETALGLIKRGSSLVADDLTCIRKDVAANRLMCSASDSTAGFMEIRGIGILNVASVFGVNAVCREKDLQLIVTMRRLSEISGELDRVAQKKQLRRILGVDVQSVILPVSEGRDLVNLVETAVQQFKLRQAGHDPVKDLSRRLRDRMAEKADSGKEESYEDEF